MKQFEIQLWDTLQKLSELRRDINPASRGWIEAAPEFPSINIWTNAEGATVCAEIPGLHLKDLDVAVLGETITLRGKREPANVAAKEKYHRRERGHGPFSRSFQLPFRVEADKVAATYQRGVLEVFLPRAEADKAQQIQVKAS